MKGYSLVEVLVVLLLIALLCCFGLPFGSSWYQTQIGLVMAQDIKQAIHQATSDALRFNEPVTLMPILEGNWSSGLVLRLERTGDILYQWQWKDSGNQVHWQGFQSNDYLRFAPDLNQSVLNGYFFIENASHQGIKLVVNRLGRVRPENR